MGRQDAVAKRPRQSVLDDDLELNDYVVNFRRIYGNPRMDAVLGSLDGSVRFFGWSPTSMKLKGLDRHDRLIDSYKKTAYGAGQCSGYSQLGLPMHQTLLATYEKLFAPDVVSV